jgi:RNA recognition motif-containing protein
MKLHIGNLAKGVTTDDLTTEFAPVAAPTSLDIVKDQGGESKGYGFAEFSTDELGQAVITSFNGKEIRGQAITVAVARPRKSDLKARPQA